MSIQRIMLKAHKIVTIEYTLQVFSPHIKWWWETIIGHGFEFKMFFGWETLFNLGDNLASFY
jgi:hypothetical protein